MKKANRFAPIYDIIGRLRKNYPCGAREFATACRFCENHGKESVSEECQECMCEVQSHFKYNGHYPMGKETFLVACANCENKCNDVLTAVCISCQSGEKSGFKYKPRVAKDDFTLDMKINSLAEGQIRFECSKCGYVHINPSVEHFETCPGCAGKNK